MEPGNDMAGDELPFRIGDLVETAKGAKFWGEIIAFDNDGENAGCTVLAIDPEFAGTKHVYPLRQLRARLSRSTSTEAVALTYGQKLIAEAIEAHFGERVEEYDEDVDDTSNHDAWEAFDAAFVYTHPSPQGGAEPGWQPGGTVEFTGNGVVYAPPLGETGSTETGETSRVAELELMLRSQIKSYRNEAIVALEQRVGTLVGALNEIQEAAREWVGRSMVEVIEAMDDIASAALTRKEGLTMAKLTETDELIRDLTGALNFIIAFYEPGQRYLDTEAWKHAEAGGRSALAKGKAYLDWDRAALAKTVEG